ncbi:MAG: gamma-glutamyltransferase family protein [Eubacteriales bacterium]|nr:gamma-glutamyltransferase family protein [Eubacteriales bacterium]
MNHQTQEYPFPSRRSMIYAQNGMVCTSQPLAATAGLDVLKRGGNAIDAAVATAACMTVVEPTSNGIGSDAFALVWIEKEKKLYGLNASGKAPMAIDAQQIRDMGYTEMPITGWHTVMVPGAPSAWAEMANRFGALPLTDSFRAAVSYAENGYPLSPVISKLWDKEFHRLSKEILDPRVQAHSDGFRELFRVFMPKGRAPKAGEVWNSPDHAKTLRLIAETNAEAFYRGELADRIDVFSRETGGLIRKSDLENYRSSWVEPIHVEYKGHTVWEIPPNGDGIIVLMAMNILKNFHLSEGDFGTADTLHKQMEAIKLAYADGNRYIADPDFMKVSVEDLLSEKYAAERAGLIGDRAVPAEPGKPNRGGTIYLCTADKDGNMVSYIQSNYWNFGSGLVVPGTGISLQNRGTNFSLDPESENCIAPGKKAFHTIIPGFLSKGGEAVGPFGVMGGFMQPQGQMQVLCNALDFGMNPQAALDAPRFQWTEGMKYEIEDDFSAEVIEELRAKGHDIQLFKDRMSFGRGQIIWKTDEGVYGGATEPRADGTVAAW